MCGQHLREDLVNLTVLHVRWSSCCDSLKDAPNRNKKIDIVYTEKKQPSCNVTAVKCCTNAQMSRNRMILL